MQATAKIIFNIAFLWDPRQGNPTKLFWMTKLWGLWLAFGTISFAFLFLVIHWKHYTISPTSLPEKQGIFEMRKKKTIKSIDDSSTGLFWFSQITDIHISEKNIGRGLENLEYFLSLTMPCINPLFVLSTGDLTDARAGIFQSRQQQIEWDKYHHLLAKFGVLDKADFWFDIRGNHDCYGVVGFDDGSNFFAQYSSTKVSQYYRIFDLNFGKYAIITLDGCPNYGPAKPFNFFGIVTTQKMNWFEEALRKIDLEEVDHVFVLSHYPLVTLSFELTSSGIDFTNLSKRISVIFSGHLHKLFGLGMHSFYSRGPSGLLDLELNDLKDSKTFRIMAVDNDIISFVDNYIDGFPFILITNPPDARFLIDPANDTLAMLESSHVRVLIFSPSPVVNVSYSIDDGGEFPLHKSKDLKDLFVAPWNPKQLGSGFHFIQVKVVDSMGAERKVNRRFSSDGTIIKINTLAGRISSLKLQYWLILLFLGALVSLIISLGLIYSFIWRLRQRCQWEKWKYDRIKEFRRQCDHGYSSYTASLTTVIHNFFIRICVVLEDRLIFFLVLFHLIVLLVGPLMITKLIPFHSRFSCLFAWGIWTPGLGWSRTFDTMFFVSLILYLQVIPGNLVLLLLKSDMIMLETVSKYPDGFKSPLDSVYPSAISHSLFLRLFVFVWWSGCLAINVAIFIAYGFSSIILGFGNWWHLLFVTFGIVSTLIRSPDSKSTIGRKICD